MGYPVVHFEVMGKDVKGLRKFFGDSFGWQIADGVGPANYMLVQPNAGSGIRGGIGACPEGSKGHVTFYVGVPSVAGALESIEKRGGTKITGPDETPGGIIIGMFRDPEGHEIGLVQIPSE